MGQFLWRNFFINLRRVFITNKTIAKIKKSHISQMVKLKISPTKNRARKIMIKVSRIPMGGQRDLNPRSLLPQSSALDR